MTPTGVERRGHPRQTIPTIVYADLDSVFSGMLYDLSESGIAMILFVQNAFRVPANIEFRLPGTLKKLAARGRLIWKDEASQRAGVQFVNLTDTARIQIRGWLSSQDLLSGPSEQPEEQTTVKDALILFPVPEPPKPMSQTPAPPTPAHVPLARRKEDYTAEQPAGRLSQRILGVLAGLLMVGSVAGGIYVALGHRRGNRPSSNVVFPLPTPSTVATPPARAVSGAAQTRQEQIILQVAASNREDEATALVAELRRKGFPAYLVRPETDKFYRVQVGPYGSTEAAGIAQRKLEADHYSVLVVRD